MGFAIGNRFYPAVLQWVRYYCGSASPRLGCRLTLLGPAVTARGGCWPGVVSAPGIVKLFENACGAVDVSGLGGEVMADCVFQAAAAVMIWFQTAKRLVISVRHSGALIR